MMDLKPFYYLLHVHDYINQLNFAFSSQNFQVLQHSRYMADFNYTIFQPNITQNIYVRHN